jgi:hypothetical protein
MEDRLVIKVHPQTVPTTAAPFHPTATHRDALGMPVAFGSSSWPDGTVETWTYHPTPCCGAAMSCTAEGFPYCKACYEEVDWAYGNVPVEPIVPITEAKR